MGDSEQSNKATKNQEWADGQGTFPFVSLSVSDFGGLLQIEYPNYDDLEELGGDWEWLDAPPPFDYFVIVVNSEQTWAHGSVNNPASHHQTLFLVQAS